MKSEKSIQNIQLQLLVLFSVLIADLTLFNVGMTTVSKTYITASGNFWKGISPYSDPGYTINLDWYKYSPFFSMIFGLFLNLNKYMYVISWQALNALIFWMGLSRWYSLVKIPSWFYLTAFISCFLELDTALKFHQVNPMLIGLTVWALAAYRDRKYFLSGFLLMAATNIKILPVIFLAPLLIPFRKEYFYGILTATAVTFLGPALVVGPEKTFIFHVEWFSVLFRDFGDQEKLNLTASLMRAGFVELFSEAARISVFIVSLFYLFITRLRETFPWHHWFTLGVCAILLVSPLTEIPTFVFLAPAYLLITIEIDKMVSWRKHVSSIIIVAVQVAVTLSFCWLWDADKWQDSLQPAALYKTFGALALWCLSLFFLIKDSNPSGNHNA